MIMPRKKARDWQQQVPTSTHTPCKSVVTISSIIDRDINAIRLIQNNNKCFSFLLRARPTTTVHMNIENIAKIYDRFFIHV
jgi:hypothetical protein